MNDAIKDPIIPRAIAKIAESNKDKRGYCLIKSKIL